MGLEWGFDLKNKKNEDFRVPLTYFCGWNSKDLLQVLEVLGTPIDEEEGSDIIINLKELYNFGNKLKQIQDIFHGISDRIIDECSFKKKTMDQYADLCYDIGIPYDEIIIQTLLHLSRFIIFLSESDMFEDYIESTKDNYLVLWQSW